jgi:CdiI immunity protein
MNTDPTKKHTAFTAEEFPALQDFLGAYFHEDFVDEYGSADAAAKQFCEDATPDEVAQTNAEWHRLLAHLKGQPLAEWQAALRKLGAAWQVASEAELVRVGELLAKHAAK